jgi:hypothetical protein
MAVNYPGKKFYNIGTMLNYTCTKFDSTDPMIIRQKDLLQNAQNDCQRWHRLLPQELVAQKVQFRPNILVHVSLNLFSFVTDGGTK